MTSRSEMRGSDGKRGEAIEKRQRGDRGERRREKREQRKKRTWQRYQQDEIRWSMRQMRYQLAERAEMEVVEGRKESWSGVNDRRKVEKSLQKWYEVDRKMRMKMRMKM